MQEIWFCIIIGLINKLLGKHKQELNPCIYTERETHAHNCSQFAVTVTHVYMHTETVFHRRCTIKTGSFSTFFPPPSPPLIWQSLCNLGLKWLLLKMPWARGSWYFPLITLPHYHHKALSTSLALLITLFRLPWHILSFADALCKWMSAWARKERTSKRGKETAPLDTSP